VKEEVEKTHTLVLPALRSFMRSTGGAGFEGDALGLSVEEQLHVGDGFFLEQFHGTTIEPKVSLL